MKIKFYTLGLMLCLAGSSFAQKAKLDVQRGTPVLDGEIDAAFVMTNQLTKSQARQSTQDNCNGEPAPGPMNNTATFGMLWDDEFLYLAAKVVDGFVTTGDGIEVFYSLTNSMLKDENCEAIPFGTVAKSAYTFGDGQFMVTQDAMTEANNRFIQTSEKFFKKTSDGFVLEIAMAWSDMAEEDTEADRVDICKLDDGSVLGLDVFNADSDGGNGNTQIAWNQCCSNRNWGETLNFGEITLRGKRGAGGGCIVSTKDMKNIVSTLSLYPNPANSREVEVNLNAVSSETVKVSVVNALSENLFSTDLRLNPGQNILPVSVADLSNGLYYIMVSNGKSVMSQKLVVAK